MVILYIIGAIFIIYLFLAFNGRPSKTRAICLKRYNYYKNSFPDSDERKILFLLVQERFPSASVEDIANFIDRSDCDINLVVERIIIAEANGIFY